MRKKGDTGNAHQSSIAGIAILLFLILVVLFEQAYSIKFSESSILLVIVFVVSPFSLFISWLFHTKLPKKINYTPWLVSIFLAALLILIILIYSFASTNAAVKLQG